MLAPELVTKDELNLYSYRPVPGNPWWEQQVDKAVRHMDTARLDWLLDLAEREERALLART